MQNQNYYQGVYLGNGFSINPVDNWNENNFHIKENKKILENAVFGVIVVDMQKGYLKSIENTQRDALLYHHAILLQKCEEYNIPVVNLNQKNEGKITGILKNIIKQVPRNIPLGKKVMDGFTNKKLSEILKEEWKVNTVLLT